MTMPRTAVILRNPAARRAPSTEQLAAATRLLAMRPASDTRWSVEVRDTRDREDMLAAAGEAVERGVDAVLACGGDGTLNVVLSGICAALERRESPGPAPAIGMIPRGTGNVWAKEAGIPRRLEDAVAMLEHGERHTADLGVARIGEAPARPFLLMCGIGLDAGVVQAVDARPGRKQRIGRAAFVGPAVAAIGRSRAVETTIEVDGECVTVPLRQAIAGNSRLYAGVMRLASDARVDDGMLDLVTFTAPGGMRGRARSIALALRALRGGLATAHTTGITYQRGRRIVFHPTEAMPVQIDGDYFGLARPDAPLTLTVLPAAVTVIVGERARVLFDA